MPRFTYFFFLSLLLISLNFMTLSASKSVHAISRTKKPDFLIVVPTASRLKRYITVFSKIINSKFYSDYNFLTQLPASIYLHTNIPSTIYVSRKTASRSHPTIRSHIVARNFWFTIPIPMYYCDYRNPCILIFYISKFLHYLLQPFDNYRLIHTSQLVAKKSWDLYIHRKCPKHIISISFTTSLTGLSPHPVFEDHMAMTASARGAMTYENYTHSEFNKWLNALHFHHAQNSHTPSKQQQGIELIQFKSDRRYVHPIFLSRTRTNTFGDDTALLQKEATPTQHNILLDMLMTIVGRVYNPIVTVYAQMEATVTTALTFTIQQDKTPMQEDILLDMLMTIVGRVSKPSLSSSTAMLATFINAPTHTMRGAGAVPTETQLIRRIASAIYVTDSASLQQDAIPMDPDILTDILQPSFSISSVAKTTTTASQISSATRASVDVSDRLQHFTYGPA